MLVDPTVESPLLIIVAVSFVMSSILLLSTSPLAEHLNEDLILIDESYSIFSFKGGVSFIINIDEKYIDVYPHGTIAIGVSSGLSVSFGVVANYENPGDYRKWFKYIDGGFFVGGGYCYNPYADNNDAAKAYYIEISSPNVSFGRDYYIWDPKYSVWRWGN